MNRLFVTAICSLLCLLSSSASLQAQTKLIVPTATIAPDSTIRQIMSSPEAIMTNLMMEPKTHQTASLTTLAKVEAEAKPDTDPKLNWRMVTVALLLMAAIALRRRRSQM